MPLKIFALIFAPTPPPPKYQPLLFPIQSYSFTTKTINPLHLSDIYSISNFSCSWSSFPASPSPLWQISFPNSLISLPSAILVHIPSLTFSFHFLSRPPTSLADAIPFPWQVRSMSPVLMWKLKENEPSPVPLKLHVQSFKLINTGTDYQE